MFSPNMSVFQLKIFAYNVLWLDRRCKVDRPITDGLNTDFQLDIGNGVWLEKVDKLCYLGGKLDADADGGCDSAVTTRVRSAWKKFR